METNLEALISVENKAVEHLSAEEECEHYKQRLSSLKLVMQAVQQQLAVYKNRCSGVDTVVHLLKETKQEVAKLTRQKKALETAVANLQNRLSINGLSSSVNIMETELFVPGASKQTLDNLARENARLRSFLKSTEGMVVKKPENDTETLMINVENLESENSQLKAQLQNLEGMKLDLARQYENKIEQLIAEMEQAETNFNQERKHLQDKCSGSGSTSQKVMTHSVETQTFVVELNRIVELKTSLKQCVEQCLQLNRELENTQDVSEKAVSTRHPDNVQDQDGSHSEEVIRLTNELQEVKLMNQHWKAHSNNQEQNIHSLMAQIADLEDPAQMNRLVSSATEPIKQENNLLRAQLNSKEHELEELRKEIQNRLREINMLKRPQPLPQNDLVEILKQQIQVCTEDFNTERKDREKAVNRAKELQEQVNMLKPETERLQAIIENLRKAQIPPVVYTDPKISSRYNTLKFGHMTSRQPQFMAEDAQTPFPHPRLPINLLSQGARSGIHAESPPDSVGSAAVSDDSPIVSPQTVKTVRQQNPASELGLVWPRGRDVSRQAIPLSGSATRQPQPSNFASLPRNNKNLYQEAELPESYADSQQASSNMSMPVLHQRSAGFGQAVKTGEYLTCPKCNKEFPEDQSSELLRHIDVCAD